MIWLLPTLPASHISLPLALPKTFPSCCSASTRIISTLKVFAAASPECSFQILFHVGYPRAWQFREFFSVTLSKSAFSSPVPDVLYGITSSKAPITVYSDLICFLGIIHSVSLFLFARMQTPWDQDFACVLTTVSPAPNTQNVLHILNKTQMIKN